MYETGADIMASHPFSSVSRLFFHRIKVHVLINEINEQEFI